MSGLGSGSDSPLAFARTWSQISDRVPDGGRVSCEQSDRMSPDQIATSYDLVRSQLPCGGFHVSSCGSQRSEARLLARRCSSTILGETEMTCCPFQNLGIGFGGGKCAQACCGVVPLMRRSFGSH